jgi:hypothetical protein
MRNHRTEPPVADPLDIAAIRQNARVDVGAEERHAEDMRELLMDREGPSRPQDGRP